MVKTEYYTTRPDGVVLNRTYSNVGLMVERGGVSYSEAVDPAELDRQYMEVDEPIGTDATEADYLNTLERLGVIND